MSITHASAKAIFQSTLPRGSDGTCAERKPGAEYFNPRSLAGATRRTFGAVSLIRDFNPRSLAGATLAGRRRQAHASISIHAPSRERQAPLSVGASYWRISIHAPSRERPGQINRVALATSDFNPRSLAGATGKLVVIVLYDTISIHAPSRERPCNRICNRLMRH